MKINFNGYYYIGKANPNASSNEAYRYNENYFNNLIADRKYSEAIDYLNNFEFANDDEQNAHLSRIDNLKRTSHVMSSIYGKIPEGSNKFKAVDFFDRVFSSGANSLEHVKSDNPYLQEFITYKDRLGSYVDDDGNMTKATRLSIKFEPERQNLTDFIPFLSNEQKENIRRTLKSVHLGGLDDVLVRDNRNNFRAFCDRSGLTKEQLKSKNVEVTGDDEQGYTLTFDKSNDYANQILYNIQTTGRGLMQHIVEEIGGGDTDVDKLSNLIARGTTPAPIDYSLLLSPAAPAEMLAMFDKICQKNVTIKGYDAQGNQLTSTNGVDDEDGYKQIINIRRLIDETKGEKDEVIENAGLETVRHTSLMMGYISDDERKLRAARDNGLISTELYKEKRNELLADQDNIVRALPGSQYKMYSNYNNDDETLSELDTEDRQDVIAYVSQHMKDGKVSYQAFQSDGQIGTLITIDADDGSGKNSVGEIKNLVTGGTKRLAIFVPGLFEEEAQRRLNSDFGYKAMTELNQMETWGYDYNTLNNKQVRYNEVNQNYDVYDTSNGTKTVERKGIDKTEALKYVKYSMAMEDGLRALKRKYTNNNGDVTNAEQLRSEVEAMSIAIANNIYSDVEELSVDNIFHNPSYNEDTYLEDYLNSYSKPLYRKAIDAIQLHNYFIESLQEYYDNGNI